MQVTRHHFIKRLVLLGGLWFVAILLSALPREKKDSTTQSDSSVLVPTARADDVGIIALTGGSQGCSEGSSGGGSATGGL